MKKLRQESAAHKKLFFQELQLWLERRVIKAPLAPPTPPHGSSEENLPEPSTTQSSHKQCSHKQEATSLPLQNRAKALPSSVPNSSPPTSQETLPSDPPNPLPAQESAVKREPPAIPKNSHETPKETLKEAFSSQKIASFSLSFPPHLLSSYNSSSLPPSKAKSPVTKPSAIARWLLLTTVPQAQGSNTTVAKTPVSDTSTHKSPSQKRCEKSSKALEQLQKNIDARFLPCELISLDELLSRPLLPYSRLLLHPPINSLESLKETLLKTLGTETWPFLETQRYFAQEEPPHKVLPHLITLSKSEKLALWNELSSLAKLDAMS